MIYAVKVDRDYNSLLSPNTEQLNFFLQSEKISLQAMIRQL